MNSFIQLIFFIDIFSKKLSIWQEIADVVNRKYKSNITSESIRIRVALNRDKIREEIGLESQINVESNNKEIPNNGINLNNFYMVKTFLK